MQETSNQIEQKESDYIRLNERGGQVWCFALPTNHNYLQRMIWNIDRRIFSWDGIPSIGSIGIIRNSYFLVFIIPVVDRILENIDLTTEQIELIFNVGFIKLQPGDELLIFELDLPYSWILIYISCAAFAIGLLLFELFRPFSYSERKTNLNIEVLRGDLQTVAMSMPSSRRQLHLLNLIAYETTLNEEDLRIIPEDQMRRARNTNAELMPLPSIIDNKKLNQYSIFYLIKKMDFDKNKVEHGRHLVNWFSVETKMKERWVCSLFFLVALMSSFIIFMQGLLQILK